MKFTNILSKYLVLGLLITMVGQVSCMDFFQPAESNSEKSDSDGGHTSAFHLPSLPQTYPDLDVDSLNLGGLNLGGPSLDLSFLSNPGQKTLQKTSKKRKKKKVEKPFQKPMVVVITGISSSGKTTIVRNLMKRLTTNWILQEVDKVEDDEISEDEDANTKTIERIQTLAKIGLNVICDTVLLDEICYQEFVGNLQKDFHVFTILIHCPIIDIPSRVESRNSATPRCANSPEEGDRSVYQALLQYEGMYKTTDSPASVMSSPFSPGLELPEISPRPLTQEDIRQACTSPHFFGSSILRTDEGADRACSFITSRFGLKNETDQAFITPKFPCDLILDNSNETNPKDIASKILDFIKNKEEEINPTHQVVPLLRNIDTTLFQE